MCALGPLYDCIMTNNANSHSHCRHEATKAARTACRKLRAQGIDTTAGQDSRVAHRLHRHAPDHNLYCCWHVTMSMLENYSDSQAEDPTAAWCQGEPTDNLIFEQACDGLGTMCHCDGAPDTFSV